MESTKKVGAQRPINIPKRSPCAKASGEPELEARYHAAMEAMIER
jgi:hypothetical protein